MKKSVLELTQNILSALDSENVNSVGDSVEALQVVDILETTYFDITATRDIPEHYELIKMTALSDSSYPSHFSYPINVKAIDTLDYQNSDGLYRPIKWCEPMDFLSKTDGTQSNYDSVVDKHAGTTLRIANDTHPTFYTSFDDEYLIFNSYESTVEATLQESKVRAWGSKHPTFSKTDSFTPDIDATMFPYYLAEAKSSAMSLHKGGSDPKVEQAARRHKSFLQDDMYRTKRANKWTDYGR